MTKVDVLPLSLYAVKMSVLEKARKRISFIEVNRKELGAFQTTVNVPSSDISTGRYYRW